jgi:hypothetical protein
LHPREVHFQAVGNWLLALTQGKATAYSAGGSLQIDGLPSVKKNLPQGYILIKDYFCRIQMVIARRLLAEAIPCVSVRLLHFVSFVCKAEKYVISTLNEYIHDFGWQRLNDVRVRLGKPPFCTLKPTLTKNPTVVEFHAAWSNCEITPGKSAR